MAFRADTAFAQPEIYEALEGGFYKVPQKPGLGITLDEAALQKYRVA